MNIHANINDAAKCKTICDIIYLTEKNEKIFFLKLWNAQANSSARSYIHKKMKLNEGASERKSIWLRHDNRKFRQKSEKYIILRHLNAFFLSNIQLFYQFAAFICAFLCNRKLPIMHVCALCNAHFFSIYSSFIFINNNHIFNFFVVFCAHTIKTREIEMPVHWTTDVHSHWNCRFLCFSLLFFSLASCDIIDVDIFSVFFPF